MIWVIRHALVRLEQAFHLFSSLASSSVVSDYFPALVSTHTKIQNPPASLPALLSAKFPSCSAKFLTVTLPHMTRSRLTEKTSPGERWNKLRRREQEPRKRLFTAQISLLKGPYLALPWQLETLALTQPIPYVRLTKRQSPWSLLVPNPHWNDRLKVSQELKYLMQLLKFTSPMKNINSLKPGNCALESCCQLLISHQTVY